MVEVKDSNYTSILEMCGKAILEKADIEAGKIIDNILDVNTDPKKKRSQILNRTTTIFLKLLTRFFRR
ncbi:MAG: hypothetical protein UGF45_13320 [Massilioclostridium sp.]|nr:hypothetical protein [Massilioclostridium sp.]MEE1492946.1 hypothetical protein [Massilioclostridium sp.]